MESLSLWADVPIRACCTEIITIDPLKYGDGFFEYIDISSINREIKQITTVATIANVNAPSRARQLIHKRDVLVSTVRPELNAVALVPDHLDGAICSTGFCVLRPIPDILDSEYLFAWARHPAFIKHLVRLQRGAGYPAVRDDDVKDNLIPLPPLPEQQRIVAILRQAADLRRQRREADQLAQKLLPALFNEMFGDPMENPKGWDVTTIEEITSLVTSGLTPRGGSSVYTAEGPYFIRSQNVRMNRLDLSDVVCITTETHNDMKRTKIRNGDVLLNITGASIGRVAWIENINHEANVSQHVCMIRLKQDKATPQYVSVYLSLPYSQKKIMTMQTGASRQGLNHQQVRRLPIQLPPYKLQIEFTKQVQLLSAVESHISNADIELNDLFSSTLARAFAGELTAAWREAHHDELHRAAVLRDDWLKERGVRRTITVVENTAEAPIAAEHSLLAQLSSRQQRLYALVQRQSTLHFTAQSLIDSQVDEKSLLEQDVIARGLVLLESLGLVQQVSVPVSSGGTTSYQRVYRIPAAYDGTSDLEALRKQYPNIHA